MKYSFFKICLWLPGILLLSPAVRSQSTDKGKEAISIPLGGNTWATTAAAESSIRNEGIVNWTDQHNEFQSYFRISQPGQISLSVEAASDAQAELEFQINQEKHRVTISGSNNQVYEVGNWQLRDTGYIRITVRALSCTGKQIASLRRYIVDGTALQGTTAFVKNNEGNFFYWGRRGPSVHLNYLVNPSVNAEWYYNEVRVPKGNDHLGSYFMAIGFGEGYFGMQVNSASERRILFSVWSPFKTDDPSSIPEDQKIRMLKKGADVHAGEFGNEGSGGQSFLRYNWKAGQTYRFLLHGQPGSGDNTIYSAYFFAPETGEWKLIASFSRPHTHTWLTHFHSFLENFIPQQGDKTRKVYFANQWVCDSAGQWTSISKARFTYDNTAAKGYRMDYAGGAENGMFYLQNDGFFNHYTTYATLFERIPGIKAPVIDFAALP